MPKKKLPAGRYSWSPELAYAIGLLVTDGNLSKNGRSIVLKSKDLQLLQTFKACLQKQNKIKRQANAHSRYFCIQIGDVQFYRWLLTIGLFPKKTYTIGWINFPSIYFRDFLRGHLDGDGTITVYVDDNNIYKGKRYINTRLYVRFISASQKHILWLHHMLHLHAPAHGALIHRKGRGKRVDTWEIKIAKYDSIQLLQWIYYKKDLPCLHRKRKIAERVLRKVHNGKLIR